MKHLFLIILLLHFALNISSQIYSPNQCEERASFSKTENDNAISLDEYVYARFSYPTEQMIENFASFIIFQMVINADGSVTDIEILSPNIIDSVKENLVELIEETKWLPAKIGGRSVTSGYDGVVTVVSLNSLGIPKAAEPSFKKLKKYFRASFPRKNFSSKKKEDMMSTLKDFYDRYPINNEINAKYAQILSSMGKYDKAHEVLKGGMNNPKHNNNKKAEILVYLLSAIFNDLEKNHDSAKIDYEKALALIDESIGKDDLGKSVFIDDTSYWSKYYKDLLISEGIAGGRNIEDMYYRDKISNEWSFKKRHEIVSEVENKGLLNSGEISQTRDLLKNIQGGDTLDKTLKLISIRTLVMRLYQGKEKAIVWLEDFITDNILSKSMKFELDRQIKNIKSDSLTSDDIIHNVTHYFPTDDKADTPYVNDFFSIREEINKIYNFSWLETK